jgi:uncharacterized protein (UPF0548 family)
LNVFNPCGNPVNGLTYPDVGATGDGRRPAGYNHLRVQTRIGPVGTFAAAAENVMTWRMHQAAGMRIIADRAREGLEVVGHLGPFRIPCRVVWTREEPAATGFGYGTMPGHPECGEESFMVESRADGVWLVVTAFSRPAAWFTRIAGPVTVLLQHGYAHRLGRCLRRLVYSGRGT